MEQAALNVHVTNKQLSALASDVDLNLIRRALPALEVACQKAMDTADAFADVCKSVAENARIDAGVLKKFVTAKVRDKLEENQNKAEQLTLLFESIE